MGIKDTEDCELCNEKDYIEHMFYHCKALNGYWDHVSKQITAYTGINMNLSLSDIMFGLLPNQSKFTKKQNRVINHILLIAKMCISKQRYGQITSIRFTFDLETEYRKKYFVL